MNDRHIPEHVELLKVVALGEGHIPDEALDALRACPTCQAELSELLAIQQDLLEAVKDERAALDQVSGRLQVEEGEYFGGPEFGGAELVRTFISEQNKRSARSSYTRMVALLVAAALLLMLFVLQWQPSDEQPDEGPMLLGTNSAAGVFPVGAIDSFDVPFRWELESSGWFELRVYAYGPNSKPGELPVSTSPRVEGNEWTWPEAERRRWPDRIRWEVRAFDATGIVVESVHATVELVGG